MTICLLQQSFEILCFQLVLSRVHNSAAADLEQQLGVWFLSLRTSQSPWFSAYTVLSVIHGVFITIFQESCFGRCLSANSSSETRQFCRLMKRDSSAISVGIKVPNLVMQKARMLSLCLCQRHPGINPDRLFLLLIFFSMTKSGHMWLILNLVKSFKILLMHVVGLCLPSGNSSRSGFSLLLKKNL